MNNNYRVLMSVCVCVRLSVCLSVCLCVCVHDNSKLEHILVIYGNSSDEFDIGHCPIKVEPQHDFEIFLHLPQYKLSSPISQLWHRLGSCDCVCLFIR